MEEVNISAGTWNTIYQNNNNTIVPQVLNRSQKTIRNNLSCKKHIVVPYRLKNRTNSQLMLQEIFKKTKYKFNQLALELGISASTLYRLFNGKIKKPNKETFMKVLTFWCSVIYLPQAKEL